MVEYEFPLDNIFYSLADPTRRDILQRVSQAELSVGEIAHHYNLTFAAVSKHIKVLEKAKLIMKRKQGKYQYVKAQPSELREANEYLRQYEAMWQGRFSKLDALLKEEE